MGSCYIAALTVKQCIKWQSGVFTTLLSVASLLHLSLTLVEITFLESTLQKNVT